MISTLGDIFPYFPYEEIIYLFRIVIQHPIYLTFFFV